jgi:tetratricopeptide (TPR) repeat protein
VAHNFEKKDRHVIPNWRSFINTGKLGELNGSKGIKLDSSFKPDITDILDDWSENKNLGVAGDLLGVALLSNQQDNLIVKEISEFIIKNRDKASVALIHAANLVNQPPRLTELNLNFDEESIDTFKESFQLHNIFNEIALLKKKLIQNPLNSIAWVEISRLHAILGQQDKAERAMKNAIFLSPENRFVLRNSARFFTHIGHVEFAHEIIRKSSLVKNDPWVMATEISLATLQNRSSRFTKAGLQIIESNSFHPFNVSELASALATLEFKNASVKKSKKLFSKSLINPNDNSLAQAEWAEQEDTSFASVNPQDFKVNNSFEALARDSAQHRRWKEAIDFSKKWFLDLPFSKGAVIFGNEIAYSKLKDHDLAVEIAKAGLVSHPNDIQLINNIVYSLCLQDKVDEAEKYLLKVKKEDLSVNKIHQICLTASKGLFCFRKGFKDEGRLLYFEAMKISKEVNNLYLNSSAYVNYCREEVLVNEIDCSTLIPRLEEIIKYYPSLEIANDATNVIALYKKNVK